MKDPRVHGDVECYYCGAENLFHASKSAFVVTRVAGVAKQVYFCGMCGD